MGDWAIFQGIGKDRYCGLSLGELGVDESGGGAFS